MAGPLQMYLYVHDAILRQVADFEARARELNRDDTEEIAAFAHQMSWFHNMLLAHEKAEEDVLFPAMNQRHRFVAETYQFDHDDFEDHLWADMNAALTGLGNGNGDRKEQARQVYRETVALHEHMRLHISKENELLVPKLETEFDLSEQAEMAGAMAGVFDPQLMGQTVGWMYDSQSPADREGMVRFLQRILPPEAFTGMTQMLAAKGEAEWAEVKRRIPELNGGNGG